MGPDSRASLVEEGDDDTCGRGGWFQERGEQILLFLLFHNSQVLEYEAGPPGRKVHALITVGPEDLPCFDVQ